MLRNISYNNPKIKNEILKMIGDTYTLFERIKMNGIGSSSLKITASSSEIQNLLDLDNNDNCCNIEIRKNGLIIRFRSLLETYGLIIPFYKLKLLDEIDNHMVRRLIVEDDKLWILSKNGLFSYQKKSS